MAVLSNSPLQRSAVGLAFVAVAIATWLTAYVPRADGPAADELLVWGALVAGLGVTAALAFDLGRRQMNSDITGHDDSVIVGASWRRAIIAATAVFVLAAVPWGVEHSATMARGFVLTTLAIVAAVPAAATLFAVAMSVASAGSAPSCVTEGSASDQEKTKEQQKRTEKEGDVERLVLFRRLRLTARTSVTAMGSLVGLTTFALGAARLVPPAPGQEQLSAATVLVFGGVGTALIAAVYSVAHRPLRDLARELADELAPLKAEDPAPLREQLEQREKLEHQLGLDVGLVDELRIGVFVYGPLLSAAVSLLLAGG